MTSSTLIFSAEESRLCWLNTDFISVVKYLFFLFKILHYLKVTYSIPKALLLQMAIVQYFPLSGIKVTLISLKILNIYSVLCKENRYLFTFYIHLHKCKWLSRSSKAILKKHQKPNNNNKKTTPPHNFKPEKMYSSCIFL